MRLSPTFVQEGTPYPWGSPVILSPGLLAGNGHSRGQIRPLTRRAAALRRLLAQGYDFAILDIEVVGPKPLIDFLCP